MNHLSTICVSGHQQRGITRLAFRYERDRLGLCGRVFGINEQKRQGFEEYLGWTTAENEGQNPQQIVA